MTFPKIFSSKDLGLVLNTRVSAEDYVVSAANKACRMLSYLKRPLVASTYGICLPLYTIFVRAHLQYAMQTSRSTPRRRGIGKGAETRSDARQMASPRPVYNVYNPYITRPNNKAALQQLRIFSLTHRRIRGDLISTYKITHGFLEYPMETTFTHQTSTRPSLLDPPNRDGVSTVANTRSAFGLSDFRTNYRLK